MTTPDSTEFHLAAPFRELVDREMATRQRELRELVVDVLATSDGVAAADLGALDVACTERMFTDSSYWTLAALTFEDRAVQLAEAWLDDADLSPARRERLIELLTAIPGYWQLRGLDDDLAEQVISARGISVTPPPLSAKLGVVLGVLALTDRPADQERILVG